MTAVITSICVGENRLHSRYALRLPVLFSWRDEIEHRSAGFTRDIGLGGAFVFAQLCPPVGAMVHVELVVPLSKDDGREIRLRCDGRVIRLESDSRFAQGFALAGDFAELAGA